MANFTNLIFGCLSLVFVFLTVRDYLRNDNQLSATARIRLRIAIIFALVALGLTIFQFG